MQKIPWGWLNVKPWRQGQIWAWSTCMKKACLMHQTVRKSLLEIERSGWSWGVDGGAVEWVNVKSVLMHECQSVSPCICIVGSWSADAGEREPSSRGKPPPPSNAALPIAYNLSPLTLTAAQYVCWGTVVGKVAFCSHQHPFCPSNCPWKQRVPWVGTLFVFSISMSNWQLRHSRKLLKCITGCLRECSA